MYAIEVKNLVKTFKQGKKYVNAVDGVTFNVKKGEIFGLLGINGAGKTTTINMLTGLLKNDAGSIAILSKDPEKDWEFVKNRINVSTAYFPLSDILSIRENLRVYAKIYNIKNVEEKIQELLDLFELTDKAERKVVDLSSGEKTRTALCKGLLNDPEVLFLDECTVGLDPDIAEKTRRIIKNYHERTKCTILFTSHYMYEVEELCDRIAFMNKGKIIKTATAKKLKDMIKKQTIELTGDTKKIGKLLNNHNVTILSRKGATLSFEIENQSELYTIMQQIFKEKISLEDLHIQKPTLDDIFIHFARK